MILKKEQKKVWVDVFREREREREKEREGER